MGFSRTGPLLDAVDTATTRLRMVLEGSWSWQGAEGTAVVPGTVFDGGRSPGGISLSAAIRGLLSRQEEGGSIAFREWGTRGSIRYDRGGDDLGLTIAISPAWGATGSRPIWWSPDGHPTHGAW